MKFLVLYASIEGQTQKIARFVSEDVKKAGHDVVLVDADDPMEISFAGIDGVILAAPVHQRRHPKTFEAAVAASKADINRLKSLLISVSLSAAFPEGAEEAKEYVTEMKMRTGLEPDVELLVAGAVRTNQYDYFANQVVRHVVLRGRPYDPDKGEQEFTDWQALSLALAKFLK